MKNKQLILEHGKMMDQSRELIELKIPKEINLLFYTILSLVICLVILFFTVKINDVIKVPGIVRTMNNNSTVNNVLSGQIDRIYYVPNQYVQKGDVLYSLKQDTFCSLLSDLDNELYLAKDELLCMDKLLDSIYSGTAIMSEGDNLLMFARIKEYFDTINYYEKQIMILDYRYQREKNQPEGFYNQKNTDEAYLNYSLCKQELEKYKATVLSESLQRKRECEKNIKRLGEEIIRTKKQYEFLEVKAPISGFIQEITALNEGDYVFPNQEIVTIIPDDAKSFRVEMSVPTKNIGEITSGMKVKYRLSAFPFYEYKGADGNITAIDSDIRQGVNNRVFYRVYSDISRTSFRSNKGIDYPLRAGIEVDARIVLDKMSVMHFILKKMDFLQ